MTIYLACLAAATFVGTLYLGMDYVKVTEEKQGLEVWKKFNQANQIRVKPTPPRGLDSSEVLRALKRGAK